MFQCNVLEACCHLKEQTSGQEPVHIHFCLDFRPNQQALNSPAMFWLLKNYFWWEHITEYTIDIHLDSKMEVGNKSIN